VRDIEAIGLFGEPCRWVLDSRAGSASPFCFKTFSHPGGSKSLFSRRIRLFAGAVTTIILYIIGVFGDEITGWSSLQSLLSAVVREIEPFIDDMAIVDSVLSGETDRFEVIVRRYRAALLRLATSRVGRLDWAEEVLQETFFSAFRSLHTYDSKYSFRTWLWTILINQCHRHHTKQARYRAVNTESTNAKHGSSFLDSIASGERDPVDCMMDREQQMELEAWLAVLPETQAEAIRLRFLGEFKYQEIADVMKCGLSTAKFRVKTGLRAIGNSMASVKPMSSTSSGEKLESSGFTETNDEEPNE